MQGSSGVSTRALGIFTEDRLRQVYDDCAAAAPSAFSWQATVRGCRAPHTTRKVLRPRSYARARCHPIGRSPDWPLLVAPPPPPPPGALAAAPPPAASLGGSASTGQELGGQQGRGLSQVGLWFRRMARMTSKLHG